MVQKRRSNVPEKIYKFSAILLRLLKSFTFFPHRDNNNEFCTPFFLYLLIGALVSQYKVEVLVPNVCAKI